MPLLKGKDNFSNNVREMILAGHPQKQALAAAYSVEGEKTVKTSKKKKKSIFAR